MNILIVDDNEDNRYMLEALFRGNGYNTISASNGAEAVEQLKSAHIDLIISDILMPVMDGFELCRKVRKDEKLAEIPFIFYTATYTGPRDEELAKKIGADRFIIKPCEPEMLLGAVRELLDGKQRDKVTVQDGLNNGEALQLYNERLARKIEEKMDSIREQLEEGEVLKLYNERLVRKLEQKMLQLEKSEELFKNLFKYHAAVKLIIDPDNGNILDANEAAVNYYGWPYGKITGMRIQDINTLPPDEIKNAMRKVRGQKRVHYEFRHRRADGSVRDVDVFTSNIKVQGRDLLHSIIHDITERKRAEISLQKTRLQLQLFIEHAPAAIAMFDNEMKYISASNRFMEDYNLGSKDIAGKSHYDLFPEIPEKIREVHRRCLAGATERSDEDLFQRSDGRTDWVRWEVRPWYEYSGEIGGIILFSEVITERKQAQEALRKSEERLRHAAEAASFGTYSYDFKTGAGYYSPEHLAIYMLPADGTIELDEDRVPKAVHPDEKKMFLAAMNEANIPGSPVAGILDIEFRIIRNAGEIRWLRARGRTIFNNDGQPERADGLVLDITERKNSEEKIKKLNRIYAVLSEINKAIVRIADQQELFNTTCRIAVETGGFRFCWIGIVDSKSEDIVPVAQYGFSENYLSIIKISISPDKEEGRGITGTAFREKKHIICNDIENDDSIFLWKDKALERGYHSLASFPLMRSNNIFGIINFYSRQTNFFDEEEEGLLEELSSDISYCIESIERDKQKEKIEEERDRLFNYSIDMMCIIGFDGYFKQLNPAWEKTLGWTNEELLAKPIIDFVHPEDRKSTIENSIRLIKKREQNIKNDLIRILCEDGTYKWLSWNLVTLPESDQIFAVTRDVTTLIRNEDEKKKLEAQLVQAQKLESLGTMAGGIAHDFNNILNIIMGYASLLKMMDVKEEGYLKSVENILDASKRGAGLVRQLLTFARKSESVLQSVSINDIVSEIKKLLSETFPKTIEIKYELQDNLPPIIADSTQIHQVFLNLCVNARDAMLNGGTLTISTRRTNSAEINAASGVLQTGEYIEIQVSDTGTGMDDNTKKKIFDPFFTTKEIGKGTGLGLSLVYSIVKKHNGVIEVISESGKGTMFYIYLPVRVHPPEIQEVVQLKDENIYAGTGTVLLIEDEKISSELLTTILVLRGYKVITAYDGLQGIIAFQDHKKDITLVICDLGLPGIDGEEVYMQIKKINPNIKMILISGFADSEILARLREAGAKHFIQKPYLPEKILSTIKEVMEEKI